MAIPTTFAGLPMELQQKIWAFAVELLPPRLIDLESLHENHTKTYRESLQPSLLHTCRESRAAFLKKYEAWGEMGYNRAEERNPRRSSIPGEEGAPGGRFCWAYVEFQRDIFVPYEIYGRIDRKLSWIGDKTNCIKNKAVFTSHWKMEGEAEGHINLKGKAIVTRDGQAEKEEITVILSGTGKTIIGQLKVEISNLEDDRVGGWKIRTAEVPIMIVNPDYRATNCCRIHKNGEVLGKQKKESRNMQGTHPTFRDVKLPQWPAPASEYIIREYES